MTYHFKERKKIMNKNVEYISVKLSIGEINMLLNALVEKRNRNVSVSLNSYDAVVKNKYDDYVNGNNRLIKKLSIYKSTLNAN
jgi:hypothetical protein